MDAAAVLLIELEGIERSGGGAGGADPRSLPAVPARANSAWREPREERDLLWKGRKNAFGAVGRVSPTYYVQDGVVPRTKIAPTLQLHRRASRERYGLAISNIFHAGDGNMHPMILFDPRKPGELEKASAAGEEILRILHLRGRLDHRRARRRDGEKRDDGAPVLRRHAGDDRRASRIYSIPNAG